MAVNFANLFMAKFEADLLGEFKRLHSSKPVAWLRFIDDIFFVWNGTEESLIEFLNFVKNYSSTKSMSSKIDFKDCYSDTSVAFLDTVVKLQNGQLVTDLFNKPTASFDYVHRSSYHPQHLINSIPKKASSFVSAEFALF